MLDHSLVRTTVVVLSHRSCLRRFPISVILAFFSLINASVLTNGFLKFCASIVAHDERVRSCTQLNHMFFEQYPNVSSLFTLMMAAVVASWFQLTFFIAIITVLTIRLSSSFDWTQSQEGVGKRPRKSVVQSMEQT